ncbi:MAG TPA: lipase maturation factor family protein [Bryobacteraceae bacterium]|nr:lipase maturation factor family protein [Bryobacteraceae bacterium]
MSDNPLVLYDGNCGFCRIWIQYWTQLTANQVEYACSQEAGERFPQIPPESFGQSVQLVMPDGQLIAGARAVYTTLTFAPGMAWLLWLYDHLPGFAWLSEVAYRLVAAHRTLFYHLTRLTFGRRILLLRYAGVEWIFLRILAAIYFIAFTSIAVQVTGLVGEHGIAPLGRFLAAVSQNFGARGYLMLPTVFWFAHWDAMLQGVCVAGAVVSIVLFLGYFERAALVCLYVLYLSLCTAGQEFLSFQWDFLLLETGFLAIFLGNSKLVVYLFRWLVFRLTFLSGAVKLMSHDPTWRNLTAMSYHFWTQPLPTPLAWYANQLPFWFQRFSTVMVFVIELGVPFLFFAPRPWRFLGGFSLLFLQTLILLTGNYTFFNLMTMALCLFLFDDAALAKLRLGIRRVRIKPALAMTAAIIVVVLSVSELWGMFFGSASAEGNALVRLAAPFGIVNSCGLFAEMTTNRPEIIVQGSNDGRTWLDYEFKYKPGDLRRAPRWVAPHQPRLDWQMWFAALSGPQGAPWFDNFMVRLLQGSPEVRGLLGKDPFAGTAPKYVRALLFNYGFTNFSTRRETGDWWTQRARGLYFPAISLDDVWLKE